MKIGRSFTAFFAVLLLVACTPSDKNESPQVDDSLHAIKRLQLELLATQIDARISNMKLIAKNMANDPLLKAWVVQGFSAQGEQHLIERLGFMVQEYQLTSASFADKDSHKYWNHEGFLRVLDPQIDTWYFAYIATANQDLISVYHDKNKHRVDLYINYQQLNGNGLSGIATSFDSVVDKMQRSEVSKVGDVFIVDSDGKVQVHPDPEIAGNSSLAELFGQELNDKLLSAQTQSTVASATITDKASNHSAILSIYMPNAGWYLISTIKQ